MMGIIFHVSMFNWGNWVTTYIFSLGFKDVLHCIVPIVAYDTHCLLRLVGEMECLKYCMT
jgi:hypothetical protein